MKTLALVTSLAGLFLFTACASRPVLPEKSSVTVSRTAAKESCQPLGKITGTVLSTKGTAEQALEDLKQSAANKGANYVLVEQYSDSGTTVTGLAYNCP